MLKRFAVMGGALSGGLLICAGDARASDTFTLTNDSRTATLSGFVNWQNANPDNFCVTGPWPKSDGAGFNFTPGSSGSIELTRNPVSACFGSIPTQGGFISAPATRAAGQWTFSPDDPILGYASLTCGLTQPPQAPRLTAKVNGLTCTVTDAAATSAGSFVSSAAPVRSGRAVVLVQHFPGRSAARGAPAAKPASLRERYEIVFGDPERRTHGRRQATVVFGSPRTVEVPLSSSVREKVREKGFARVLATLRPIDGSGRGHRTTLTVIRDRPSLPF